MAITARGEIRQIRSQLRTTRSLGVPICVQTNKGTEEEESRCRHRLPVADCWVLQCHVGANKCEGREVAR